MNREYQEKLKEIKKEEQRHLRAAKKVPPTFEHKYEMDQRTEEQLKQTQEAFALDDLRSIESSRSPERGGIGTQTDFKVVSEMAAEEEEEQEGDHKRSKQTIEENYRETVELVKKFIRVDVPNLSPGSREEGDIESVRQRRVLTTRKATDLSLNPANVTI